MHVKSFLDLGGFYPKLLPHYLSDYEFTIRAHQRGYHLIIDESFRIEESGQNAAILKHNTLFKFLKACFSPKYPMNPIYYSSFVLLCAPWRYKGKKLFQVWNIFIHSVLHFMKTQKKQNKYQTE
jgi:GT2 family glycosyltransferase